MEKRKIKQSIPIKSTVDAKAEQNWQLNPDAAHVTKILFEWELFYVLIGGWGLCYSDLECHYSPLFSVLTQ